MVPIYTNHLNLGFYKGTLLPDPKLLLQGRGELTRLTPTSAADFDNGTAVDLIKVAIECAESESKYIKQPTFKIISKIKQ
jgi:hypothetical protein